ncbi:MAG: DJ-1/PfpI family protein [Planctomycetota bacterium]
MASTVSRKVLMVIAPSDFRDEELAEPKAVLEKSGVKVDVASPQSGEARGMLGARVKPDKQLQACQPEDYDAVVVVGGMGSPAFLWDNPSLHTLLQRAKQSGKVVAGICLSGAALARAGVLQGVTATVYETKDSIAALAKGGAKRVQQDVVVDGRVITASGPSAARAFGEAIARALTQPAR